MYLYELIVRDIDVQMDGHDAFQVLIQPGRRYRKLPVRPQTITSTASNCTILGIEFPKDVSIKPVTE